MQAHLMLSKIPFFGAKRLRDLYAYAGSFEKALGLTQDEIRQIPGFGQKLALEWARAMSDLSSYETFAKNELERAEKTGVRLIAFNDPLYPKALRDLDSAPSILYVAGLIEAIEPEKTVAIVGTRAATPYGLEMAEKIAAELAGFGLTVMSGLARGIDASAHEGALKKGVTAAVIGSGFQHIYPSEHIPLARKICEKGAVLSEYSLDTRPASQNFPKRNGIVAALSSAILVIEAPLKSGALITVEIGARLGRKIFVLPGRADHENFFGSHGLIKTSQGQLIENSRDIVSYFSKITPCNEKKGEVKSHLKLSEDEMSLLKLMPCQELQFEEIVNLVKWPVAKLMGHIIALQLKGAVKEYPGKIYKKTLEVYL